MADLMAIPCFIIILNPSLLSDEDKDAFIDYYTEIVDMINEKIIITEPMDIPEVLRSKVKFKPDFFDWVIK